MDPSLEQQIRAWSRELAQDMWEHHGGDLERLTLNDAWRQIGLQRLRYVLSREVTEDEKRVFLHETANRLQCLAALAVVP